MYTLTVPEAAKILQVGVRTIRELIYKGRLDSDWPTKKRGVRLNLESVEAYRYHPKYRTDRKGKFDENFFRDFNPISAYWGGFIYADGGISKHGELRIELSERDAQHLKNFVIRDFGLNDRDIKSSRRVRSGVELGYCHFTIRHLNFLRDLKKFAGIPNKTKYFTEPQILDEFLGDFIRGVFDGDGSITVVQRRKPGISFACHKEFAPWLQSKLPFKSYIIGDKPREGRTELDCVKVVAAGFKNLKSFYNLCYRDYPNLSRKWDKIQRILYEYDNNVEDGLYLNSVKYPGKGRQKFQAGPELSLPCKYCGEIFKSMPFQRRKFCSRHCYSNSKIKKAV